MRLASTLSKPWLQPTGCWVARREPGPGLAWRARRLSARCKDSASPGRKHESQYFDPSDLNLNVSISCRVISKQKLLKKCDDPPTFRRDLDSLRGWFERIPFIRFLWMWL